MPVKYTEKQALAKLQQYCAYQERCRQEVAEKLYGWGWTGAPAEALIQALTEEDFLNEQRFADSFVGGKFRLKRWGRIKIQQALSRKGVDARAAQRALRRQIPEEDYREALRQVIERKADSLSPETDERLRRQKLLAHALAAGYESDLVQQVLQDLKNAADDTMD